MSVREQSEDERSPKSRIDGGWQADVLRKVEACVLVLGNACSVSNENKNLQKLVQERGEFMLVQRVDHLAVQTLVYIQHQYFSAYLYWLVDEKIVFLFYLYLYC